MSGYRALPRDFYDRGADVVAEELLGKSFVRKFPSGKKAIGLIVETEAYLGPQDLAAHSSKGQTVRNKVLFGPAGHAYIYLIYGIYDLLNVSTGPEGSGVLIRALEPISGIEGKTSGPGLLTKSLQIDRSHNSADLTDASNDLHIADDSCECLGEGISVTPRIGVDYAGDWKDAPLRFFITGNPFVSRSK